MATPRSIHQDGPNRQAAAGDGAPRDCRFAPLRPAHEIVFVSGGTEADNLAILGSVRAHPGAGKHVITTAIEHPAVLNPCRQLEREGVEVTYVRRWDREASTPKRFGAHCGPTLR